MEKFVSKEEVAKTFGVSEKTVQRWTAAGLLRPARIGARTVRYRESDLEALFEQFAAEKAGAM